MNIAIIGAGAAGCFAAISIKRQLPGAQVDVYEGGKRALAKVSITGGGRCNLTNSFRQVKSLSQVYPRGERLMKRLLKGFSHTDTYEWFESEGVKLLTQEDECVFPVSQSAMEIVDTLLRLMRRHGVRLHLEHRVKEILHEEIEGNGGNEGIEGKFRILFNHEDISEAEADIVVIATGGSPHISGLDMIGSLDIEIEQPVPSLFSLCLPGDSITELMGTVVEEAAVSIPATKHRAIGPLLITHWGMSGPAVLKMSSHAARHLHSCNYKTDIIVNWFGDTKAADVEEEILRMISANPKKQAGNIYPRRFNSRLWQHLLGRSQINPGQRFAELQRKAINRLLNTLTADIYHADGKCRFKEEFVTCGGVALSNVSPSTLECRHHAGLYFAGEVLDVDAVTGGFNLQAAWTMAHTVARAIAAKSAEPAEPAV